jgi:hypothetical protein
MQMKDSELGSGAIVARGGGYPARRATEGKPLPILLAEAAGGAVFGGGSVIVAAKVGSALEWADGRHVADSGSRTGNFGNVVTGAGLQWIGEAAIRDSEE